MADGNTLSPLWLDPEALADTETPCYVFQPSKVVATYEQLKAALGTALIVSLKANPNLDLFVRCAHAFTDGIELASQGELTLVVGRTTVPKFVNCPALDHRLITAAIASRATLILDNLQQVEMAVSAFASAPVKLPVMLRVNAASIAGDAAARVQADHFGMDVEALKTAAERLALGKVEVRGLHMFAGSYTFEVGGAALCRNAVGLVSMLEEKLGRRMNFLNLGGGFADDWDGESPKFAEYRALLEQLPGHLTVAHEAGRAIFARGGTFITRVLAMKRLNKRHVAICDGGLAHCFMLAQTEKVMKRFRRPKIIQTGGGSLVRADASVVFVGNSCNRSDIIGEQTDGILPRPGDFVVFDNCGAYHTYTPTNFLQLKSPAHYVVS